uniref:Uncharacterized protein n=1 Tax=Chromera velia CCMP2878 TaxID=1169474 RepID=A0A0G4I241_9ALVE|mmetsp:Transcript_14118/g.28314  ORF Transcript_14118/g.28314 Transcript_14118/m.28314 type:complete len:431 (-) Transcript_14118:1389-2681(-)|eukprot:Cvel_10301.t1-p1 / transcript=Cvel_10301.t1 / gene=Cvel_10301 / organism=Chromera_velia_CCMP2878 / gene_product=hypothetical protein / transcript_product=hypothetical protein / location=Cvel_scaffold618:36525-37814(+) / protein_length=430 / sequence_SO=supercontig / SO=protein_coding / is_pseudo=false
MAFKAAFFCCLLPLCSAFAPLKSRIRHGVERGDRASARVLEFVEPSSNVRVVLLGCMHFNPASGRLVRRTLDDIAQRGELSSVLIELCPDRWKEFGTASGLEDDEMIVAFERAQAHRVPTILGDENVRTIFSNLIADFRQTCIELVTPWRGGWASLFKDLREISKVHLPSGKGYLGWKDFFDREFLRGLPVAFLRYPRQTRLVEKLYKNWPFILGFFLLDEVLEHFIYSLDLDGTAKTAAEGGAVDVVAKPEAYVEFLGAVAFVVVALLPYIRPMLKTVLRDRNQVIAQNILKECRRLGEEAGEGDGKGKPEEAPVRPRSPLFLALPKGKSAALSSESLGQMGVDVGREEEGIELPDGWEDTREFTLYDRKRQKRSNRSEVLQSEEGSGDVSEAKVKTVVAVLGSLHCNGVKKLISEGLIREDMPQRRVR